MEIPKVLRFFIGLSGVMITGFLLYCIWRIYDYLYGERKPKPAPHEPPLEAPYETPNYFYDSGRREFYVRQE
jgi:hypothetical protein